MEVHYANIIAYRVTPNELVLEFGNFFAGQDENRLKPDHTDFKVRIVLSADMLDVMIQALNKAKEAREQVRASISGRPAFTLNPPVEERHG